MTFAARQYTVGTAAVALATATEKNTHEVTLYNDSNKSIYIGGAAVTTANGFHIPASSFREVKIANGDVLYAISTDPDGEAHVFDFQVDP
jgi:hypothetical protein